MVDLATVEVVQDDIGWVVRVSNPGMRTQEYRCASQKQAASLAAILQGTKVATGVPTAKVQPAAPTKAASPSADEPGPAGRPTARPPAKR